MAESILAGGPAILPPTPIPDAAGARTLAAGVHLTCAVTAAAEVRCWGSRELTVTTESGGPLREVGGLALGGSGYGCASNPQGVYCWGKNDFGQLARPLNLRESAAALLAHPGAQKFLGAGIAAVVHDGGERVCAWGRNGTKLISATDGVDVVTTPECFGLRDVVALAVGDTHACARHPDGRFSCWGERYYGQLGIGGVDTADVAPPGAPTALTLNGAAAKVVDLAAGVTHTCALTDGGAVVCFGRNDSGQIGPGAVGQEEEIRTPLVITGVGEARALGAGSAAQHTCAIRADGRVVCWGKNHAGQLGADAVALDPARRSAAPLLVGF